MVVSSVRRLFEVKMIIFFQEELQNYKQMDRHTFINFVFDRHFCQVQIKVVLALSNLLMATTCLVINILYMHQALIL